MTKINGLSLGFGIYAFITTIFVLIGSFFFINDPLAGFFLTLLGILVGFFGVWHFKEAFK